MKRSPSLWPLVSVILTTAGCIVSDQLTTLTIQPDGSVDLVMLASNIRSTLTGDDGAKELADYQSNFGTTANEEFQRIKNAGGAITESNWIRPTIPYSNYLHATLPNSAALEKFATLQDDDGLSMSTKLHSDGPKRRLTIRIALATDKLDASLLSTPTVDQLRQEYANGISETRMVIAGGVITNAKGFTLAEDKQSALLDVRELAQLLRAGLGRADIYLEWELRP